MINESARRTLCSVSDVPADAAERDRRWLCLPPPHFQMHNNQRFPLQAFMHRGSSGIAVANVCVFVRGMIAP